jgi:putative hydrolase of the HAD superfamily
MIEAAMRISNNTLPIEIIEKILQWQRATWKPIVLLDGVEETLEALQMANSSCHQRWFIRSAQKTS